MERPGNASNSVQMNIGKNLGGEKRRGKKLTAKKKSSSLRRAGIVPEVRRKRV